METVIPDKLVFKIGEVSVLTELPPSVLRFWEGEFSELKPRKTRSGQRVYSKEDIEIINLIKRLLYSEKLTIEGARHRIAGKKKCLPASTDDGQHSPPKLPQIVNDIIAELKIIRSML